MQRVLNVIHYAQVKHATLVLLSTDTEKAFDREFLQTILEHLSLGRGMRKWLSTLYSRPSAAINVNEVLSKPFVLWNGMRQGYPLS